MKPGKPLDRRSPLKAKSAPKPRATPIKKVNRKRKAKRHAEDFGPEGFADFIRSYGCLVAIERGDRARARCGGPIEACHLKTRAAGGTWKENVFPLCRSHHAEQHRHGITSFQVRHELDLDLWCAALYSRWLGIQQSGGAHV